MNIAHEAIGWVPLFPDEEIPFILTAILRCATGLKRERPNELENAISDRLRDFLDQDKELRDRPVEVFREVPVYDRTRPRRKQLGRTDIMFLFSTGVRKPWPYFVIESKRLHVTFRSAWKPCVHKYVTDRQGMMCFIEQRYAKGLANGGMLGYVFDGDVEKARASVGAAIKKHGNKLKCRPPFDMVVSAIVPGESRISETIHRLPHGDFTIYHLFVAVP